MTKKKKTIIIIIAVVCVLVVSGIVFISRLVRDPNMQSGQEWFDRQKQYLSDLEEYSSTMDLIFSAYISGATTEQTFRTDVDVLQKEILLMRLDYEQYLHEHPVDEATFSYYMQEGCKSVHSCYTTIEELLNYVLTVSSDSNHVCYAYIAYSKQLENHVSRYTVATLLLNGETPESISEYYVGMITQESADDTSVSPDTDRNDTSEVNTTPLPDNRERETETVQFE